jgi:hypothetical protein
MDGKFVRSHFGQGTVSLRPLPLPAFGVPEERPELPEAEYENRMAALRAAVETQWIVVYGDREHFANLAYLTGFDPRFEEAMLVLGPGDSRYLLVGNEGLAYGSVVVVPRLDMVLCQSLSLMGQDRSESPSLQRCLSDVGIGRGDRVGIVGWKYFSEEEWEGPSQGVAVPAFLLDVLRDLVSDEGTIEDITSTLLAPDYGLRSRVTADQIAAFEWAASRATRAVMRVVSGTRPGMTELEAVSCMGYEGEPLSAHVMFASGSGEIVGLRSPTARTLQEGEAVFTAIGYWGGLGCRAGMLRSGEDADFTRELGAPYFYAVATWYETVKIGTEGGQVFDAIENALTSTSFRSMLNPGHLTHLDEWVHSPIMKGGTVPITSGMALQCDIIPTPAGLGRSLNCEDPVVIADKNLRSELANEYPDIWGRIVARQRFMRDQIGIELPDEVLPLSSAPAYLPPFWLDHDHVYVRL